ncbi:MAG: hypothetical protein AVDCRST_MAG30-1521, partial [uncultured Solirubrobacteraceae bacterium]
GSVLRRPPSGRRRDGAGAPVGCAEQPAAAPAGRPARGAPQRRAGPPRPRPRHAPPADRARGRRRRRPLPVRPDRALVGRAHDAPL